MNIEAILHYPIGDFQRESNLPEQIKDLITDEADHLQYSGIFELAGLFAEMDKIQKPA